MSSRTQGLFTIRLYHLHPITETIVNETIAPGIDLAKVAWKIGNKTVSIRPRCQVCINNPMLEVPFADVYIESIHVDTFLCKKCLAADAFERFTNKEYGLSALMQNLTQWANHLDQGDRDKFIDMLANELQQLKIQQALFSVSEKSKKTDKDR